MFFKVVLLALMVDYSLGIFIGAMDDDEYEIIKGLVRVRVRVSVIKKMGSKVSGVVLALQTIIDHKKWQIVWIELMPHAFGWWYVTNIFWKTK